LLKVTRVKGRVDAFFQVQSDVQYQVDLYQSHYPEKHIDSQVLQIVVSLALDYSIGAEKFIKGIAKKLGLKDPDRLRKGAALSNGQGTEFRG
jgi:hypothetical protein